MGCGSSSRVSTQKAIIENTKLDNGKSKSILPESKPVEGVDYEKNDFQEKMENKNSQMIIVEENINKNPNQNHNSSLISESQNAQNIFEPENEKNLERTNSQNSQNLQIIGSINEDFINPPNDESNTHVIKSTLTMKQSTLLIQNHNLTKIIPQNLKNELLNEKNRLKIILERIRSLISENNIPENEFNILIKKATLITEDENTSFILKEKKTFSLLKNKFDINFNKKPYSKLNEQIEQYFNENKLQKFYNFNFSSNLLEYENQSLNGININLKKSKIDGEFEDFNLNFNSYEKSDKKLTMLYFINPNDLSSIKILKEILNYNIPDSEFLFLPIYTERVTGKKDAKFKKDLLHSMEVPECEIYFLPKIKEIIKETFLLEKYINFISNDNEQKINSICLIIDENNYIRFCDIPEKINIEKINFLLNETSNLPNNYSKEKCNKILLLLNKFIDENASENNFPNLQGDLNFTISKIYSSQLTTGKIYSFMEPIEFNFNADKENLDLLENLKNNLFNINIDNDNAEDIIKNNLCINPMNFLLNPLDNIKFSEKNYTLTTEIEKIKEYYNNSDTNILENGLKFNLNINVKKRFHNFTTNLVNKISNTKFKNSELILNYILQNNNNNFNSEQSQDINTLNTIDEENLKIFPEILEKLKILKIIPTVGKINSIHIEPHKENLFPNLLKLYNTEKNEEENLILHSDTHDTQEGYGVPKLMLIFSYSKDFEIRNKLLDKLNFIHDELNTDSENTESENTNILQNIKLINIFRGDAIDQANEILSSEIIKNNSPLYLINNNFKNNFPFFFETDNNTDESLTSQFIALILDSDNMIRYCGDLSDIDLSSSFKNLIEGQTNVEYYQDFPISYVYMKENFKKEFSKFLKILENFISAEFYKPIVEFSFTKHCNCEDDSNEIFYKNLEIKIVYKKIEAQGNFSDDNRIKKYFEKFEHKFLGHVNIVEVPCMKLDLILENIMCSSCNNKIENEFFFNQDNDYIMCKLCESKINPQFREINLLYVKFENKSEAEAEGQANILNEIITEHYNTNIRYGEIIENFPSDISPICLICGDEQINCNIIWMSLIHLDTINLKFNLENITENNVNEDGSEKLFLSPVFICDSKCFEIFFNNNNSTSSNFSNNSTSNLENEKEKRNLKKIGVDVNNIVLRKVTLPNAMGF